MWTCCALYFFLLTFLYLINPFKQIYSSENSTSEYIRWVESENNAQIDSSEIEEELNTIEEFEIS